MLVVFAPTIVVDTKIIAGRNFVATLNNQYSGADILLTTFSICKNWSHHTWS